jgi:hypothetical protein
MPTNPNTTEPAPFGNATPTDPVQSGSISCQVTIPDYNDLRYQNIKKINTYYKTLLDSYTKNYSDYATQSASNNVNDRTYASTTIMPNVQNSNSQIINLSQAMINNVNQDNDLILEQKKTLVEKMDEIDSIITNINLLSDKDTEMTVLSGAKQDSLNSTTSSKEDMQFTTYIYIGICILLVIIIIGLIIYLVYSNYTSKESSNNLKSNSLYKNINTNNISRKN